MKKYVLTALFSAVGLFLLSAMLLVLDGLTDNIGSADVAVVFGNTVAPDGTPSRRLQARLDKAIEMFRQGLVSHIFVSGAIGIEGHDEALVMEQYLLQNNIPRSSIITDSQGKNTYLTARHVAQWLAENKYYSAMVITQYYHIPRATLACRRFAIPVVYAAHADLFELRDVYATFREVVAWLKYLVRRYA